MGFPVRLRVTTFLPRLTRLIVSRPDGGSASPLHQGDRNFTCTNFKLSKICWFTSFPCLGPPPWSVGPFRRNGSQLRILPPDEALSAIGAARAQSLYDALADVVSVCTHHMSLRRAKEFFAWCVSEKFLSTNPFTDVKPLGRPK